VTVLVSPPERFNCLTCGDRILSGGTHACWVAQHDREQDKLSPPPLPAEQPSLFQPLIRDDGNAVVCPPPYLNSSGVAVSMDSSVC